MRRGRLLCGCEGEGVGRLCLTFRTVLSLLPNISFAVQAFAVQATSFSTELMVA